VGQLPVVRPPLTLEHFEHRDLLCIQWIAFDLLQMHRHEPPFARAFDLCLC
jgi:hypothetical protein